MVTVTVLRIAGDADVTEPFRMFRGTLPPGSVVVISISGTLCGNVRCGVWRHASD
jgi:hypothetical protein